MPDVRAELDELFSTQRRRVARSLYEASRRLRDRQDDLHTPGLVLESRGYTYGGLARALTD